MGLPFLKLELANVGSPSATETVEFLIDSGAIYSIVPRPILERLGILASGAQDFRLASGQTIRRQTGGALFKYQDRVGVASVIFGEEGDATLLGAHTLEALGLSLDPVRRELVPLPMMLTCVGTVTSGLRKSN